MPLKDLDKLTVVKLRAELIARGLDSKGNKPFLVERLRFALDQEEKNGGTPPEIKMLSADEAMGDTSIDQENADMEEDPTDADQNDQTSPDKGSNGTPTKGALNNGSHPVTEKPPTLSSEVTGTPVISNQSDPEENASADVSYSNSAPNDSILAVYGGKDETYMEDSTLDQSLDLTTPIKGSDVTQTEPSASPCKNDNSSNGDPTAAEDTIKISDAHTADEVAVTKQNDVKESLCDASVEKEKPMEVDNPSQVSEAEKSTVVKEPVESLEPAEETITSSESAKESNTSSESAKDSAGTTQSAEVLHPTNTFSEDKVDANKTDVKENVEGTGTTESLIQISKDDEDKSESKSDHERGNKRPRDRSSSPSPLNKSEDGPPPEDEPEWDHSLLGLDWYNSDLNLIIQKEGFASAAPLTDGGFAYMWAGARATYGFSNGKVCYEVKITENLPVAHLEGTESDPHLLRVGWSLDSTSLQLGEEQFSYGFGGKGKISQNSEFSDYGAPFQLNDVVGVYMGSTEETDKIEISYTINGESHGVAFSISKEELAGRALFPHILTKNCRFEVNFGQKEEPWFPPVEGYEWASKVPLESRVRGTPAPLSRNECQMIMMCGLPGSGKTTWAKNFCSENADCKFNVLGTNAFLDKMKVNGLPRRKNYNGRWEVLIEKCTRCLNILLEIAAKRRRNYILDQTNVYPTAQKRKMSFFSGFQRKAIVIVPSEEEAKTRVEKRIKEEGKDVPDSAVMEMKANFKIPAVDDTFSEVIFPELGLEEALKVIEKYSAEAKAAGFGQPSSKRPRQNYSNRSKNERDTRRPHHSGGGSSGGGSGGGGGGRDRPRDSRGSNSHRNTSSRSYRDSRDDNRHRPPPLSSWRGGSGGPGGGGGGRGGGGPIRGSWGSRGPLPPPPVRSGPYSPRRGPPPPPSRGGWSAPPPERSYPGSRSSSGGGGGGGGRSYDDRRNDRPSYSTPRRDVPSPWMNPQPSMSSSVSQRSPWSPSPQPWSSNSSSSYGQQSSYGSSAPYGGPSGYSSAGAARPTSYGTPSTARPASYGPSSASRPTSYGSNGPARPTSYGQSSMPSRPSSYGSSIGGGARPTSYPTGGGSVNPWSSQPTSYQYPYNQQNHSAYSGGK